MKTSHNITLKENTLTKKTQKKIGGTTYVVSSIFNQKAKGNVVDKIARLIKKEIDSNH